MTRIDLIFTSFSFGQPLFLSFLYFLFGLCACFEARVCHLATAFGSLCDLMTSTHTYTHTFGLSIYRLSCLLHLDALDRFFLLQTQCLRWFNTLRIETHTHTHIKYTNLSIEKCLGSKKKCCLLRGILRTHSRLFCGYSHNLTAAFNPFVCVE